MNHTQRGHCPRTMQEAFGPYTDSHITGTTYHRSTPMRTYLTVVIAILAFLILCLIGSQAHAAEPIIPTRDNPEFTLRIIFDTPANIRRECVKLGAWGTSIKPRSEVGCTAFNLDTKVCTVYSPTPRELDDNPTAILGHEVLHCMSGRYHEE